MTRVGSLFTGYGGLCELAAAPALGGTVAWHAEIDPAACRVLAHRYPGVPNLGDVAAVDWARAEPVDVVTAGYPCQPFSAAGRRLGESDDRYMWPEVERAVRGLGPRLVVLENVSGHLVRGFPGVLGSLASLGYDARWACVRASGVGAPHRRERLFVVAWPADAAPFGCGPEGRHDGLGAAGLEPVAAADAAGAPGGQRRLAAAGQAPAGRAHPDAGGRGGAPAADAQGEQVGAGGLAWARAGRDASDAEGQGPQGARPEPARCGPERGDRPAADATGDGRHERRAEPAGIVGGPDAAVGGAPAADAAGARRDGRARTDAEPDGRSERQGRRDADGRPDWGPYAPAVRRWEHVLGRPAPAPTEPGRSGQPRLSPRFVEWMQGLPDGWVTEVPGVSRNDALRLLGNGVVPQQAAAALELLLGAEEVAA